MQGASFNLYSETQCLLQFPYLHKSANAGISTKPQPHHHEREMIIGTVIKGSYEDSHSEYVQHTF